MDEIRLPKNIRQTEEYLILGQKGVVIERFRLKSTALCSISKLRSLYGKDLRIVTKEEYKEMRRNLEVTNQKEKI